jgi:TadE-like protein
MVSLGSEAVREPSRPHSRGRFSSERGTAVVEFALVAPMLFLLVLGILDFGRALNYYNDLTQLAGQGARAAAVDRNPDGTPVGSDGSCTGLGGNNSIQCQLGSTYTSTPELKNGITVCIGTLDSGGNPNFTADPVPTMPVVVRASYHFNFLPFIGSALPATSITLTATQSERQEVDPTYAPGCLQP